MAERFIEDEIENAIAELLIGYGKWKAEYPTLIRYQDEEGLEESMPSNPADGDHGVATLWLRSGSDSLHETENTFGSLSDEGEQGGWASAQEYVFRLEMVSALVGTRQIDRSGSLARTAIRKGKRKIGLEYVLGVRVTWDTDREDVEEAYRWITRMDIRVSCMLDGSDLLDT